MSFPLQNYKKWWPFSTNLPVGPRANRVLCKCSEENSDGQSFQNKRLGDQRRHGNWRDLRAVLFNISLIWKPRIGVIEKEGRIRLLLLNAKLTDDSLSAIYTYGIYSYVLHTNFMKRRCNYHLFIILTRRLLDLLNSRIETIIDINVGY